MTTMSIMSMSTLSILANLASPSEPGRAAARCLSPVLVCMVLLLCGPVPALAAVRAYVDRNPVPLGESLTLTIEQQGRGRGQPDLSPLEQDFQVLGSSSGTSISIVNGHAETTRTWSVTLMPKRTGRLEIPPLDLGGEKTAPITLDVSPAEKVPKGERDVFMELDVQPRAPYVGQEVVLTVRIYYTDRLRQGSLTDPQPPDTVVRRLGEDRGDQVVYQGRRLNRLTRRHALYPRSSGTLRIPGPVFSGQVVRPVGGRNQFPGMFGFDLFSAVDTRPVRIQGREVEIEVRPRPPESGDGPWLPARDLLLSEEWRVDKTVRVGDPITRIITVEADGLPASQLPDLAPRDLEDFNVYPDKPREETEEHGQGLVGRRSEKIAFIPVRAGTLTIPGLELRWWDTDTDRPRTATLPPRTITVLPAERAPAPAPAASPRPDRAGGQGQAGPAPGGALPAVTAGNGPAAGYWPWISLALGLLWLATLGLYLHERGRGRRSATARRTEARDRSRAGRREARARLGDLRAACRAGDAKAARQALLAWAAAIWPQDPPAGLEDLARRIGDTELAAVLRQLDAALYAGAGPWQGGAGLWEAMERAVARLTPDGRDGKERLPGLWDREEEGDRGG